MSKKQDITLTLKGCAILSVLINHYVTLYIAPQQTGYANGIIAIFFILSGYGIFYSLDKYKNYTLGNFKDFWGKRLIKIFPLYWLSLLIYFTLRQDIVPQNLVEVALAFPWNQAPEIYWFITSLMQCYLLAPCLYLIIKKIKVRKYLLLIIILIFASFLIFPLVSLPYNRTYFVYRYLFLGHLFLFALGMAIPKLLQLNQPESKFFLDQNLIAIALVVFSLLVYYTRFANTGIALAPFFAIAAPIFCLILIFHNPQLPKKLNQSLSFLGINSYSLYLFHLIYYKILEKSDLFANSIFYRVTLTIIFLPVFFLVCIFLEKFNNVIAQYFFTWLKIGKSK